MRCRCRPALTAPGRKRWAWRRSASQNDVRGRRVAGGHHSLLSSGFRGSGADLDLGARVQPVCAAGDDVIGRGEAAEDLADAALRRPRVTARLSALPSALMTMTDLLTPSGAVCTASVGMSSALAAVRPVMVAWTGVPALNVPLSILDAQPHFDRRASGIERRADERDLGRHWIGEPGNGDGGCAPVESCWACSLREVELGQQRRGIHDRDHGVAGSGRFPGKERPVSHHARDGTANLRIAQLGFGAQVLALGGGELSLRALEGGLVADLLHRFEMLLGNFMGGLGLNQRSFGGIQIAAWDRSLGEELGAAVHNTLGQVQVGARLGQVQLAFTASSGTVAPVAMS